MKVSALAFLLVPSIVWIGSGPVFSQPAPAELIPPQRELGPMPDTIRRGLLAGIAFYPDEIISAIFAVSQEPASLMGRRESRDPDYQKGYAFLSSFPEILKNLREHPIATRVLGSIYRNDPDEAWATIDQIRADYKARAGISVAEAVTAPTPPAVPLFLPVDDETVVGQTGTVVEVAPQVNVVESASPTTSVSEVYISTEGSDMTTTGMVMEGVVVQGQNVSGVQGAAVAGTAHGENASVAGYGVAAQGENAAHVGAGGVAANEEGQVKVGTVGSTVIQTGNGTVALGHAGQTNVDTQEGTFDSSRTAGGVNSQGEGVVAHQEASGSWDADSYQRSGSGNVQATNGQGAEWTHQGSGQVSETGASHSSSTHVETNSGKSADVEHSASVEKTGQGFDVEHGGSATTGSGQTYEWGNRGEGNPPIDQTAGRFSAQQGWDFFRGGSSGGTGQSSRYARQGNSLKSAEVFSGRNLNSTVQKSALQLGQTQLNNAFRSVEPMIAQSQRGTSKALQSHSSGLKNPSAQPGQRKSGVGRSGSTSRSARQHSTSRGHGGRGKR